MRKALLIFILVLISIGLSYLLSLRQKQPQTDTKHAVLTIIPSPGNQGGTLSSASDNQTVSSTTSQQELPLTILSYPTTVGSGVTSVRIAGKTAPSAIVMINDTEVTADGVGNFARDISLDEGENYFTVFAYTTDAASADREIMITREVAE